MKTAPPGTTRSWSRATSSSQGRTQNRLTLNAKTLLRRLTGTRSVARSIWRTTSRPASTYFWLRRLVRSTPDSDRSIANSLPVSSLAQIASAPAPGPQPISRTWSAGWTSMRSTAHLMRGGMDGAGMAHSLPDGRSPVRHRHTPGRTRADTVDRVSTGDEAQVRVGVLGARGKVGSEVCRAVEAAPDTELVASVDAGDDVAELARAGDEVVVDFNHP